MVAEQEVSELGNVRLNQLVKPETLVDQSSYQDAREAVNKMHVVYRTLAPIESAAAENVNANGLQAIILQTQLTSIGTVIGGLVNELKLCLIKMVREDVNNQTLIADRMLKGEGKINTLTEQVKDAILALEAATTARETQFKQQVDQ